MSYTLEEICAMADARCTSYGKIKAALDSGAPLPPLRRSTKWPEDSTHHGEDQLPGTGRQKPAAPRPPDGQPSTNLSNHTINPKRFYPCDRCGEKLPIADTIKVHAHRSCDTKCQTGPRIASLCPECAAASLPGKAAQKSVHVNLPNRNGVPMNPRHVAECAVCAALFNKLQGAQIYVRRPNEPSPHIYCYVCPDCFDRWAAEIQKSARSE